MKPLRVAVAGSGDICTLAAVDRVPAGLEQIVPAGGSTRWTSVTPFVPPRFLKARGRNNLEGQVKAELLVRGFAEPRQVRVIPPSEADTSRQMRHFVRRRRHQIPPVDAGYALELEFDQPVAGPVALGFGSHFGLGLFRAAAGDVPRRGAAK
jgi:CRISPR-associated protein Csb2